MPTCPKKKKPPLWQQTRQETQILSFQLVILTAITTSLRKEDCKKLPKTVTAFRAWLKGRSTQVQLPVHEVLHALHRFRFVVISDKNVSYPPNDNTLIDPFMAQCTAYDRVVFTRVFNYLRQQHVQLPSRLHKLIRALASYCTVKIKADVDYLFNRLKEINIIQVHKNDENRVPRGSLLYDS